MTNTPSRRSATGSDCIRLKAVRTDRELQCAQIDSGLVARGLNLVALPENVSEEQLIEEVREADLLLTCYTPITVRVIAQARQLRGIVKYGVGIDAIDIAAARARGIPVVNIPEYAAETVAEGAFALMITLARKLAPLHLEMCTTGWAWPVSEWLGLDLAGKTLALVGVGRIGRNLARMAGTGFRMRVLGFDPHVSAETMYHAGVEKIDGLEGLLPLADFVSLHSVLNSETRHLIGRRELGLMKPSSFLINVSRGALVDEAALLEALTSHRIAGAGLDVYSQEPLRLTGHPLSPFFAMPNVILMPHLTFYTREAMGRLERETLERCDELLQDRPVLIKSHDPRLRAQERRVRFA